MPKELKHILIQSLQRTFQFKEFRPGQLNALMTLMTHGRLLCIQPTGHGKSLLYQLPATLFSGITLVISPLLALMRDQIMQLQNRFNISAASINTDQNEEDNFAAKQAAKKGKLRLLFIAPEQLDHIERFNFLLSLPISLLVVDEAHCISTWGHDFRPSYRQIIQLAHSLANQNPEIKLLALTATANEKTEIDIIEQLQVDMKSIVVHRETMNRPNIKLSVIPLSGTLEKLMTIKYLLSELTGLGIIYCATRENSDLVADYLSKHGIKCVSYHAGIEVKQKMEIQKNFILDKYDVITATNALGMGIDKANLRFVIHFDFPGSITAYYQEVGRCGRDGLPANGVLLYDPKDSKIQKYFIDSSQPQMEDFHLILTTIGNAASLPNFTLLKNETGLHTIRLSVILRELIEQKFIKKISHYGKQVYQLIENLNQPNLQRYSLQLKIRNFELVSIQHYAEQTSKCLMWILREALGDQKLKKCGQCNICSASMFKPTKDQRVLLEITSWLNNRTRQHKSL